MPKGQKPHQAALIDFFIDFTKCAYRAVDMGRHLMTTTHRAATTPPPQTWSLDERIETWERRGDITPALTPAERDLAWNCAAALHFWQYQQELPGRAPDDSAAIASFDMGISRVKMLRKGR
jgi:hypothetical protein